MRIQFLQSGNDAHKYPPVLAGGFYEDLINNYQIKDEEKWDTGCGVIIHIWPAICDGRIKESDDPVGAAELDYFLNQAIYCEISYLLVS
jgi:hypothetical protein